MRFITVTANKDCSTTMDNMDAPGNNASVAAAIPWWRPSSWLASDTRDSRRGLVDVPTVLLICVMYLLSGLVGHDPWRPDEIYAFGIVHDFLTTSGNWIVPTVA